MSDAVAVLHTLARNAAAKVRWLGSPRRHRRSSGSCGRSSWRPRSTSTSWGAARPGRLFALASTVELAAEQPELAAELGIATASAGRPPLFTAVEQEVESAEEPVEALLSRIEWPEAVHGAVTMVHRLVLPPEAEEVPDEFPDGRRRVRPRPPPAPRGENGGAGWCVAGSPTA